MNYSEVYNIFLELKDVLLAKKEAIIKKDLEALNICDENSIILVEKIGKYDILNNQFLQDEKEELKKLGEEIKKIQENNEILIKQQLFFITLQV